MDGQSKHFISWAYIHVYRHIYKKATYTIYITFHHNWIIFENIKRITKKNISWRERERERDLEVKANKDFEYFLPILSFLS